MTTYTVIKPFTYAGRDYARGDGWEPAGHRNDAAIIRARLVQASNAAVPEARVATAAPSGMEGIGAGYTFVWDEDGRGEQDVEPYRGETAKSPKVRVARGRPRKDAS